MPEDFVEMQNDTVTEHRKLVTYALNEDIFKASFKHPYRIN